MSPVAVGFGPGVYTEGIDGELESTGEYVCRWTIIAGASDGLLIIQHPSVCSINSDLIENASHAAAFVYLLG